MEFLAQEVLAHCEEALKNSDLREFKRILHSDGKRVRVVQPPTDSRLKYKNGAIRACPVSERLRFTNQDMLEMVGKAYATALVGPVLLGAVEAVAAFGPIVELAEVMMDLRDQIPPHIRSHVTDLLNKAKKSKEQYEKLMEDLELMKDLIVPSTQDKFPPAGKFYRLCALASGKFLHETGGLPIVRYKVDLSKERSTAHSSGNIWGLVVTNRPGIYVFESARHRGRFLKVAGGSRSENAILQTSEDPDHRGCQFRLVQSEENSGYYGIKNCHSGKFVMPFATMSNTYCVQGNNGEHDSAQWRFDVMP